MVADPVLITLVGARVHQSTSLVVAPSVKPFLMYRQTSDTTIFRGDDGDMVRQTGYMIFAHDEPGDYLRIDSIMEELKRLFADTKDTVARVVKSSWLETSEDFRDDDMGTIARFARILVKYKA